ncbi:MAG: FtsQ-type POTRA domain-containing protein [Candidatus Moraniibacteriota bacterium]
MALPRKKYIQNCTGNRSGNERKLFGFKLTEALVAKSIFYFLVLAFLGVMVFVLFFSAHLKITQIKINGNSELKTDDINASIKQQWEQKLFKTIPADNFLLVSAGRLENLLANNFKKIEKVSVVKKFPDTVEISIQERKALLILCSGEQCFLVDENGIAYSQADFDSPELLQNHLLKIFDRSAQRIELNEEVLTKSYMEYISVLGEALAKAGMVVELEYWTPSLMAQEIDVKQQDGCELYFSTRFSLETALETLELVLKKELANKSLAEISYFDLRSENKVFYKLKNQNSEAIKGSYAN